MPPDTVTSLRVGTTVTAQDYEQLLRLGAAANGNGQGITLDFSDCRDLSGSAVAYIGGLIRFAQSKGHWVRVLWGTLHGLAYDALEKSGFLAAFGRITECPCAETEDRTPHRPPADAYGRMIPYRQFRHANRTQVGRYLGDDWLLRGWITVSNDLEVELCSNAHEIFNNAFEHGHSGAGVFACGQLNPMEATVTLSVVDFGAGIPALVRAYPKANAANWPSQDCIDWAFETGNSTKQTRLPGGLGLDMLKDFIVSADGTLEIYSGDGYAKISRAGEVSETKPLLPGFGTTAIMTLKCDCAAYTELALERLPPIF